MTLNVAVVLADFWPRFDELVAQPLVILFAMIEGNNPMPIAR